MNKLRKALVFSVMLMTVLSMSVVIAPEASAAAQAGDLIKMDGLSSVYYLDANGDRNVFPNEATFFSWYSDFSGVITIPQSELETYPLKKNVTIRPGTKLVTSPSNSLVYAVEPGGTLKSIVSEENAISLYGADWATRVVDVIDAFFTNYTVGDPLTEGMYPTGSLVKTADSADVYYYDGTDYRKFSGEAAFTGNRFSFDDVLTAPDTLTITAGGTEIAGAEGDLTDTSSGAGGTAGAGTGATIALANDTPVSASVPSKATGVVFTKFNVTAANDGAVILKSITIKRTGIGATTELSKVYIYDGANRLTNGKTVNSSANTITFNSVNVTIPAGTTKTLSIVADILAASTGNHALGIESASAITTDGAVVSGSFPATGNIMSLSATAVATLTATQNNGTTAVTSKIGEDDIEIADFDFDNDAEEDVELTGIVLSNGGNAVAGNLGNINLYYNGSSIATGELANNKITFTFDPILIEKSDSNINFKVKADIDGGLTNTVKLYISQGADITAVGKTYGYNAGVTISAFDASSEAYPITIGGSEVTVNFKTDNAKTEMADQKNFVFATLEVMVNEDIDVTLMHISMQETDVGGSAGVVDIDDLQIRNTTTNEIVDGTVDSGNGDTASTTVVWKFENFSWETGSASWEIRGDIPSNAGAGDIYRAVIDLASDFTARYVASNNEVSATDLSTTDLTGKYKTIGSASLAVGPDNFNSGDAVAGDTGIAIAGGSLQAGSVSTVTVTEMSFHGNGGTATTTETGALDTTGDDNSFDKTNVGTVYLKVNGVVVSQKGAGSLTNGEVTFNNFTSDVVLAKDVTTPFEVVLDIAGTLDTSNKYINLQLTSVTAKDENNVTVNAIEVGEAVAVSVTQRVDFGRVLTLRDSGKLTISMDNTVDDVDADKYLLAGTTGKKLARLKMKAEYEDILVKTIYIYNNDPNANVSVNLMYITDADGNVLSYQGALAGAASSTVPMTNDNGLFTVSKGTSYFYITLDSRNIGDGGNDTAKSQDFFTVMAAGIVAQGVGSGVDLSAANITYSGTGASDNGAATDRTGISNTATLTGVRISAIEDNSASLSLATGEQTVFNFKVTTENGSNASSTGDILRAQIKQLKIQANYKSGTVSTAVAFKLYRDGKTGYVTSSVAASGSENTFDLTNISNGTGWALTNYEIDAGVTATFYVKAYVISADTNDYVQMKLATLDGTSSTGSVKWTDKTGTDMYKLLLGKSELTGDTVN